MHLTRREVGLCALLAVVLAVLMHWPLPLHLASDVPKDLGDPLPQAWQIAWGGHALQHQPLDYWQSNMYWPLENTLAFSDALAGYAPFGLIGEGFEAALIRYNLLFLFAYALAFVGGYLLARELGLRRAGAAVAGAAFAYAPWRLEHDGHMHVISSGGIPLALFLLLRGYRRDSAATVAAGWLVAAWQLALGFTLGLMLAYLLLSLGAIAVVHWYRRRPPVRGGVVTATLAGGAAFAAVAVVLALPYQQVRDAHPESQRTPATVAAFSGGLDQYAAAPEQNLIWGPITSRVREGLGFVPEQTLFPGLLVLVLAGFGLARGSPFPRGLRIGLGAAVALLVLLSLGFRVPGDGFPYPYRALYELAPGWEALRTPGRLNTLTSLALALLAAAGAHTLLSRESLRTQLSSQLLRRGKLRTRAHLVALALPAIVLLEGCGFEVASDGVVLRGPPHPTVPAPPPGLSAADAPRLHLPMYEYESRRFLIWSTDGFPEIVNGRGSFKPASFDELERRMADFPAAHTLGLLREMGVATVVLHPDIVDGTAWEDWRDWPLEGEETGGVVIYRLNTRP